MQQQRFDELSFRLNNNLKQLKSRLALQKDQFDQRLLLQSPLKNIQDKQQQVSRLKARLIHAMQSTNKSKQKQFKYTIEQLHLVSPLATIARGYSVTKNDKQKVITSVSQTQVGDNISIQLVDGFVSATVNEKTEVK